MTDQLNNSTQSTDSASDISGITLTPVYCHKMVQKALREGRLTKSPCEYCGSTKVVGHHPDYSRPLDVVWVCRAHHAAIHKRLNDAGRHALNIHLSRARVDGLKRLRRRAK